MASHPKSALEFEPNERVVFGKLNEWPTESTPGQASDLPFRVRESRRVSAYDVLAHPEGSPMPFADEATAQAYREAWEAWNKQLAQLHRVFLEGQRLRPDQLKGLLNRESRARETYEAARLRLLGLDAHTGAGDDSENPFR